MRQKETDIYIQAGKHTYRQKGRHTGIHTDIQTDRQAIHTVRQTAIHPDIHTDRQTGRQAERPAKQRHTHTDTDPDIQRQPDKPRQTATAKMQAVTQTYIQTTHTAKQPQTGRHTCIHTYSNPDSKTGSQSDRYTYIQADRQAVIPTEHKSTHTERQKD